MILNTEIIEHLLLNNAISAYQLEDLIGISRATISNYRNGTSSFENMSLKNAIRIQKWIDDNYSMSYDYSELLEEFTEDFHNLNEYILVVREYVELFNYWAIVDYLNVEEFEEKDAVGDLKIEFMNKSDVLNEMKEWIAL